MIAGIDYRSLSYQALIRMYRGTSSSEERARIMQLLIQLGEFYRENGDPRFRTLSQWVQSEKNHRFASPTNMASTISAIRTKGG